MLYFHISHEKWRLYFFTRPSHTYTRLPYIVLNLQIECDMGWYRYTSHSENHSTECENLKILHCPGRRLDTGDNVTHLKKSTWWTAPSSAPHFCESIYKIKQDINYLYLIDVVSMVGAYTVTLVSKSRINTLDRVYPADTRCWNNVVLMLGANNKTTLVQRLVAAG